MCFTPAVSLLIALFEWMLALFFFYSILISKRKTSLPLTVPIFMIFLGLYQFTEFMFCMYGAADLWGRVGFIAYTYLPALGLCFTWDYCKVNYKKILVLLIPSLFALFALLNPSFIQSAECKESLVIIHNTLYAASALYALYVLYYFITIAYISYFFSRKYLEEKDEMQRRVYLWIFVGVTFSLMGALVLLTIFPSLGVIFPSLYCEFAALFVVTMLLAYKYDLAVQRVKRRKP